MNPTTQKLQEELNLSFPHLHDRRLIEELVEIGEWIELPPGKVMLESGQYIEYIPLVLDGIVKVKRSYDTHEIFLYFLTRGESCAMTLSACLKRQRSEILAMVIEPAKVLLVPASRTFHFMKTYLNWSEFVMSTFQDKLSDSVHIIERLAFMSLEDQIMDYLQRFQVVLQSPKIPITHKVIAEDLGTSRVIITRLLNKLEDEGRLITAHKLVILK